MSSLSRNSCAKACGNWSRGRNLTLKKPRGGGSTNLYEAFNLIMQSVHCLVIISLGVVIPSSVETQILGKS